jgi:hypothetical protein
LAIISALFTNDPLGPENGGERAEKEGKRRGEREKRKGERKDSYSRIPSFCETIS